MRAGLFGRLLCRIQQSARCLYTSRVCTIKGKAIEEQSCPVPTGFVSQQLLGHIVQTRTRPCTQTWCSANIVKIRNIHLAVVDVKYRTRHYAGGWLIVPNPVVVFPARSRNVCWDVHWENQVAKATLQITFSGIHYKLRTFSLKGETDV